MNDSVPSIGIDFGTTNSSMAWFNPRTTDAEIILNAEGRPKSPSLVHFGENETLVGEPAEDLLQDISTDATYRDEVFRRTIVSIKRNLLTPPRIALSNGRYVQPVEVVAEILKKLRRDAEDGHFHEKIERAVITCPAEFNVIQRQKIEEAGRLAGFGEVALLEEPVAGALAYARAGLDVGKHVLVYDLGGGTFDLAVLDNEDESFHVAMEPKGMKRCGGDDFDLALYHYCDEVVRESLGRPISLSSTVDLSFLRACRRLKESLTFQQQSRLSNYLPSENGPVRFEHEVERKTFEELIEQYVESTVRLAEEILKQADTVGRKVDTVVLVGGSVRVPLVVDMLNETLQVSPLGFNKRDVAIALGAAHYTSILWGEASIPRSPKTGASIPSMAPQVEKYREAVQKTFSNKKLDKVEVDRLNAFADQLGLGSEQATNVEHQIMGDSKEGVLFQQYRRPVEMTWETGTVIEDEVGTIGGEPEGGDGTVVDEEDAAAGPGSGAPETRGQPRLQENKGSPASREPALPTTSREGSGPSYTPPPPASASAGSKNRPFILAAVIGVLLLLVGGAAVAAIGPAYWGSGSNSGQSNPSPPSSPSPSPPPSSPPVASEKNDSSEADLRMSVDNYYKAVDRQDWNYAYANLDSQTKQKYARDEYVQKNQYLANVDPVARSSPEIVSKVSTSSPAEVKLTQTFRNGSTRSRTTYFVWEDGAWKHRFSQQDDDIFLPNASYDEFVRAKQSGA